MNGLKKKVRTKSFWMSVAAGVMLILQAAGVKTDIPAVNEALGGICSLLMLLGVFTAPAATGSVGPEAAQTAEPDGAGKQAPAECGETLPNDPIRPQDNPAEPKGGQDEDHTERTET